MRRASRSLSVPRVKVGTRVGMVGFGGVIAAQVVEDRGPLGPGGEQIVRVAFRLHDFMDETETELRASELVPPPTESLLDQLRRSDRAERRRRRRPAIA